jgi:tetratricopeptide (TPR) repeat protein
MKWILFSALFFGISTFVSADKIYLENDNIMEGRIVRQTPEYIIVEQKGTKNRVRLRSDQIKKIVKEERLRIREGDLGTLILSNGASYVGLITKITASQTTIKTEDGKENNIPNFQISQFLRQRSSGDTDEETNDLQNFLKLDLLLQKDEAVYEVSEPILARIQIANTYTEPLNILRKGYTKSQQIDGRPVFSTLYPLSDWIQVVNSKGKRIQAEDLYSLYPSKERTLTLYPKDLYREPPEEKKSGEDYLFDIQTRFLLQPGKYTIRAYYRNTEAVNDLWVGRLISEEISIEIIPSTGNKSQQNTLSTELSNELKEVKEFYNKKEWQSAFDKLDEMESRYFDTYPIQYWRGKIHNTRGYYEEAQRYLRTALSLKPDFWIASTELAQAYYDGRRFQDAYQTLINIPEEERKPFHYWLLGKICQTGKLQYQEAHQFFTTFKEKGGTHKTLDQDLESVSSEKAYERFLNHEISEAIQTISQQKINTDFSFTSKKDSFLAGEFKGQIEYFRDLYTVCGDLLYRRAVLIRK